MVQAVKGVMGSHGERHMKLSSLARRSPPAVRPGGLGTPVLDDFSVNTQLCYLPCVQCSKEQRKKQEEISVPMRQLLVLALKSCPEN